MLGINTSEILSTQGDVSTSLNSIMGKQLFKNEQASIMYSYLGNKFRESMKSLDYYKNIHKNNKDASVINELTERIANISAGMQVIERKSLDRLGQLMEESPMKVRQIKAIKDRQIPNQTNKEQHIYRINGAPEINQNFLKNLEFDSPKGIKFYGTIKPKQSAFLKRGGTYIILENPLLERYMTDADIQNAYAWNQATKDINIRQFIAPAKRELYIGRMIDLKDQINYSFSNRMKQAADTPIYSKEIHKLGAIEDNNLLSKFFNDFARGDGKTLNEQMVKNIALSLLQPDIQPRAFVKASGTNKMPAYKVNKRLHKALFSYLHNQGMLDIISDRIQLHADNIEYNRYGLRYKDIDNMRRSEILYEQDYEGALGRFEDKVDLVSSILGDKFNIVGRVMSDVLKNEGVVNNVSDSHIQVHGGPSEGRHRTIVSKGIKPGEKRKDICP